MKHTIEKIQSIFFILLGLSIPISVAVTNILIGLIAVSWLADGGIKRKLGIVKQNQWMLSIVFLLALYAIGMLWGSEHQNAKWILEKLALLLIFIVFATANFKQSTLKLGSLFFLFSTLISAISAILINYDLILPLHNYIEIISKERQISAFTTYNYHNLLLAFSALICFFLFAEKKSKYKWLILVCIVIYSFSIFTEGGRAGQLIFNLLFAANFVYYLRKKIAYSIGIFCCLIICNTAAYKKSEVFKSRFDNATEVLQDNVFLEDSLQKSAKQNIRAVFLKEGFNYIKKKPILGYGTGSFGSIFKKELEEKHEYFTHITPHNTYLFIWFEIGIFGLLLLLRIFYFQIKSLLNQNYKFHRLLLPVGYMTIMLVDSYLFIFVLTVFYIYFFTIYNNYKLNN